MFFDGTFWAADELIALGLGDKRAEDMAHLPIGGEGGSLARLAQIKAPQRYLHPHQQHQPHPARGFGGTRGGRGSRAGAWPTTAWSLSCERRALTVDEFTEWLQREGASRYHDHHRYHVLMHAGKLTQPQLQQWVLNRYYYQTRIPIKDALILSKSDDPAFRRMWIRRISDHDGTAEGEGGLAMWLRLAEGVGLDREEVRSCRSVLIGVLFACDAYVQLVRETQPARGRRLLAHRVLRARHHVEAHRRLGGALPVGRARDARLLSRARDARPRDSGEALEYVTTHATTRELQKKCVAALIRKTQVLWHLLDTTYAAYVDPAWGPRGPRD